MGHSTVTPKGTFGAPQNYHGIWLKSVHYFQSTGPEKEVGHTDVRTDGQTVATEYNMSPAPWQET